MKIGIVAPFTPHYIARYLDATPSHVIGMGGSPVNILCEEFLRRDTKLQIFTLDPEATQPYDLRGPQLNIHIAPYRKKAFRRAIDLFAQERAALAKAIRSSAPDVLHAHWSYEYAWAALATGLPTLVTAHDAPVTIVRHTPDWYRFARLAMATAVLHRSTNISAVSPYVAAHLRRWRFTRKPISVVPNGLPDKAFHTPRANHTARATVFAAVLTGWGALKNGSTLLSAFSEVLHQQPQSRLLLFGTGHGPTEAACQWAQSRNLCAGVEFVGQLPAEALQKRLAEEVDVLVHPSREESHGMAIIEAMAMGIPVIGGTTAGAVPWTLGFGEAGLLVDINSPAAISAAMMKLGENPPLRTEMGTKAHEYAWRNFRIGVIADAYEKLYEQCLATCQP